MAIAFNAALDLGYSSGNTTSLTAAYTVGSGANRLLVVGVLGNGLSSADSVTGVTYAGVAMTLAAKNIGTGAGTPANDRYTYLYYLLNPPSGANNVVVSATVSDYLIAVAADYTGVAQSGQPDVTATGIAAVAGNSSGSLTTPVTTTAANDWIIEVVGNGYNVGTHSGYAFTSTNLTGRVEGVAFKEPLLLDMSTTTAGAYSPIVTTAATVVVSMDIMSAVAAFKPAGGAAAGNHSLPILGVGGMIYAADCIRRNRTLGRRKFIRGVWR